MAAGQGRHSDFSAEPAAGQPPPLPLSPSAASGGPLEVRSDLRWSSAIRDAPAWLSDYSDVPTDVASPPLAMTPPHPDAVGSYGPALIAWARETQGVRVRWWQGLSICRILEHRADGSLCWEEVIISCSRRSGKSVIVRLLALWRMVFAPALFEEMQLIVHSASTLRVAKEPMRYASKWAGAQGNLTVYTNNNNYSIEDNADGHRWIVLPIDKTAGLDTCMAVLDEAWSCKPEVVDDDLEPSMMERVSPQLLLVSTAHRRATSLMRNRIEGALAGEDSDRVLLLLWAAEGDDLGDPVGWKAASPHWSPSRARYVERKYGKAVRGEQDVEFDDPDPMQGFACQYLNRWKLRERALKGDPLVDVTTWESLTFDAPYAVPDEAAIESWHGEGVSLALAWRLAGRAVVTVSDHLDLSSAVAALRESGFRGITTVGASLLGDPAVKGLRKRKGEGRTVVAVQEMRRLIAEDVVRHDGGEHLTGQVEGVRTLPSTDGLRLVTPGRRDAIKAAYWAIARTRFARSAKTGIILPTQVPVSV